MKYIKAKKLDIVEDISKSISDKLANNLNLLWLVSGGSNIEIEVSILNKLENLVDTSRLTIVPIDERYGIYNYKDSNSFQLRQTGFNPAKARFIDVLDKNLTFDETVNYYNGLIRRLYEKSDYIIAQFGLGADGHIAGIKPLSPASSVDVKDFVIGYNWSDFDRLTLCKKGFKDIDEAYLVALSDDKVPAIERLRQRSESVNELPAMLLNTISKTYVYNSYIESEE